MIIMESKARQSALKSIALLKSKGQLASLAAFYGSWVHLYRCLLLGDMVFMHGTKLRVACETISFQFSTRYGWQEV